VDTLGTRAEAIRPGDPAPGQYKLPGRVIHFRGDTIALVDFAAERLTLWNQAGHFLSVLQTQPVAGSNPPLNYDTVGYAYKADYGAVLGGLEPGQTFHTDSAAVLRFLREGSIGDTVARVKLPPLGEGRFGETMKQVPMIFGTQDLFGVAPDGAVWVARASTNSVDWRPATGPWSHGPARPFTKIPVTQADRDRFMQAIRQQMQQTNGPAGLDIQYPFADFKSPFAGAQSGWGDEVWLLRSRAAEDQVPVYDVVGRDGLLVRTVRFPSGTVVVGFGAKGTVYTATRGEDGRQTVARYRIH
jgi:hypothetical protein